MKARKYLDRLRIASLLTLLTFLFQQIAWSTPDMPVPLSSVGQQTSEKPVSESTSQTTLQSPLSQTTNEFLDDTLTLTPLSDQEEILRFAQDDDRHSEDEVRRIYELERHDFEEAVDLLRPEYASAVIVKSLSEENLKSLLNLSFETAIIVLHGEIVLFSTGGKEEIGISEPAKALLEKANFISHTHVEPGEENGPSLYDLENAVSAPAEEYVLSRKGVFKYNQTSFLNPGNPDSYENYLEALNTAKANSEVRDQVMARADLNKFIREMDSLNEMDANPQIFRASEDVSPLGRVLKLDDDMEFDGVDDLKAIANTPDINLGIHTERTISIWFQADDVSINTRKQVIYEEGGAGRGLNIYVYDGKLYVGGWNAMGGSEWQGTYLSTSIEGNGWHHVALTLKGGETISADALKGYLDGAEFGRGAGSQLWEHMALIGIGGMNNATKFHDEAIMDGNGHYLKGKINGVEIYNRELLAREVSILAATVSPLGRVLKIDEALEFDGVDDLKALDNSTDINLGIHTERTLAIWFRVDDASINTRKQVIYEEGGAGRGLNIYVYDGKLYVGGWNAMGGSNWQGTYLSTSIQGNGWHHVALTLKGGETISADALKGYLDGAEFGRGAGSQLWEHMALIGIGGMNNATRFHDEAIMEGNGNYLKGGINGIEIYNRTLSAREVGTLAVKVSPLGRVLKIDEALEFDGVDDLKAIANTPDINLGIHTERTISIWFQVGDVSINTRKQVIYEEGGAGRGLNIYVYDGKLYVGGWNAMGGSNWQGTYLSTVIQGNGWHHVALTLKGGETISADALKGYLDGAEFGRGAGSQLWEHMALIGIGGMNNATRFHDEAIMEGNGNYLKGKINGVEIYNRTLSAREIETLGAITASPDKTPPVVVLTSSNLTNKPAYTLTYTVDGEAKAEAITLNEGDNIITRSFADATGNKTDVSWNVVLDTIAPAVVLTSSALTNNSNYALTYTVDGIEMNEMLILQEGINVIARSFIDPAGNKADIKWEIVRDTLAPSVILTSRTLTNKPNYTLAYTVEGLAKNEEVILKEGDNIIERNFNDLAGNRTDITWLITLDTLAPEVVLISVPMTKNPHYTLAYMVDGIDLTEEIILEKEGDNAITRSFTDLAGNTTDVTSLITLDTLAPTVVLTSPTLTNKPFYFLTYILDGISKSEILTLREGNNIIARSFIDMVGNKTDVTWNVTLDTIVPAVVFTSPTLTNNPAYTLTYTVDGIAKSEAITLAEGNNTLIRSLTDLAGNKTDVMWNVVLDTIAPAVVLTSATITNQSNYTLNFTIDGVTQSAEVVLREGDNPIMGRFLDAAENKTDVLWNITLDTKAPVVVLTSPTLTNKQAYTLTYTEDGVAKTEAITLAAEGENMITKSFTDAAGNKTDVTWNVTLDTKAPVALLTSSTLTNKSAYTLTYTVDGEIKSESITLAAEGDNSIARSFTDVAGNKTDVAWSIMLDTIEPVVVLTSLALTNKPAYILTYTVDGLAKAEAVTLNEEINSVTRSFTDKAGNTTNVTWNVVLDTKSPVVVLTSPTLTNKQTYTLTYTEDGVAKTEAITLAAEGENMITKSFTDAAGNKTDIMWTITLDTIAPVVVLNSPTLTNKSNYTLIYTIDGVIRSFQIMLNEGNNPMTGGFVDEAGNITNVEWNVVLDTKAPVVVLTSPTLTNKPAYTLIYTVDGIAQSEVLTLNEGINILTRSLTDKAGNTTDVSWKVTLDTIAPVAVLTSSDLTNNPSYTLTYTVDGDAKTEAITLAAEGDNSIARSFTDLAGNKTDVTWNVVLDTKAPAVVLTSSNLTKNSAYTLTYTVDGVAKTEAITLAAEGDNSIARSFTDLAGNKTDVTWNVVLDTKAPIAVLTSSNLTKNSAYTLTYTVDGVAKTETITLSAEGDNSIARSFTDLAGNKTDVTWNVTLDTKAPAVVLISSKLVKDPAYTLTYTVDGEVKSESITLAAEGDNSIARSFTDLAGNKTDVTWNVVLDTKAPVAALTSSTLTNKSAYTLTYTVDGEVKSESITLAAEGDNSIARSFTDAAGNKTDVTWNVTLDTKAPVAELTSAQLVNKAAYTLTYKVDGDPRTELLTLTEGENSFTRTFMDLAGNKTDVTWIVTLDTKAPVVVLTSPTLTNKTVYTLIYTLDGIEKSEEISLLEGNNTIARSLEDLAGNQTDVSWIIRLDTIAPKVTLTSQLLTTKTSYTLTYIVDEVSQNEAITLTEGENTILRSFEDVAGNKTDVTWDITLDTKAPVVVLTSSTFSDKSNYTLTYTEDGIAKSEEIILRGGDNSITRTFTDSAGNVSEISWNIQAEFLVEVQQSFSFSSLRHTSLANGKSIEIPGIGTSKVTVSADLLHFEIGPEGLIVRRGWIQIDFPQLVTLDSVTVGQFGSMPSQKIIFLDAEKKVILDQGTPTGGEVKTQGMKVSSIMLTFGSGGGAVDHCLASVVFRIFRSASELRAEQEREAATWKSTGKKVQFTSAVGDFVTSANVSVRQYGNTWSLQGLNGDYSGINFLKPALIRGIRLTLKKQVWMVAWGEDTSGSRVLLFDDLVVDSKDVLFSIPAGVRVKDISVGPGENATFTALLDSEGKEIAVTGAQLYDPVPPPPPLPVKNVATFSFSSLPHTTISNGGMITIPGIGSVRVSASADLRQVEVLDSGIIVRQGWMQLDFPTPMTFGAVTVSQMGRAIPSQELRFLDAQGKVIFMKETPEGGEVRKTVENVTSLHVTFGKNDGGQDHGFSKIEFSALPNEIIIQNPSPAAGSTSDNRPWLREQPRTNPFTSHDERGKYFDKLTELENTYRSRIHHPLLLEPTDALVIGIARIRRPDLFPEDFDAYLDSKVDPNGKTHGQIAQDRSAARERFYSEHSSFFTEIRQSLEIYNNNIRISINEIERARTAMEAETKRNLEWQEKYSPEMLQRMIENAARDRAQELAGLWGSRRRYAVTVLGYQEYIADVGGLLPPAGPVEVYDRMGDMRADLDSLKNKMNELRAIATALTVLPPKKEEEIVVALEDWIKQLPSTIWTFFKNIKEKKQRDALWAAMTHAETLSTLPKGLRSLLVSSKEGMPYGTVGIAWEKIGSDPRAQLKIMWRETASFEELDVYRIEVDAAGNWINGKILQTNLPNYGYMMEEMDRWPDNRRYVIALVSKAKNPGDRQFVGVSSAIVVGNPPTGPTATFSNQVNLFEETETAATKLLSDGNALLNQMDALTVPWSLTDETDIAQKLNDRAKELDKATDQLTVFLIKVENLLNAVTGTSSIQLGQLQSDLRVRALKLNSSIGEWRRIRNRFPLIKVDEELEENEWEMLDKGGRSVPFEGRNLQLWDPASLDYEAHRALQTYDPNTVKDIPGISSYEIKALESTAVGRLFLGIAQKAMLATTDEQLQELAHMVFAATGIEEKRTLIYLRGASEPSKRPLTLRRLFNPDKAEEGYPTLKSAFKQRLTDGTAMTAVSADWLDAGTVRIRFNYATPDFLYDHGNVYLVNEQGAQISDILLVPDHFRNTLYIDIPLDRIASVLNETYGRSIANINVRFKVALWEKAGDRDGLLGMNTTVVSMPLDLLNTVNDLSTNPDAFMHQRENVVLNILAKNFPLENPSSWSTYLASDAHYAKAFNAVDLNAVEDHGKDVHAIANGGTVVVAGDDDWATVVIEHKAKDADGKDFYWYEMYLHMEDLEIRSSDGTKKPLIVGADVKQGDRIGGVGDKGAIPGQFHLHAQYLVKGDEKKLDVTAKQHWTTQSMDLRNVMKKLDISVTARSYLGKEANGPPLPVIWDENLKAWVTKDSKEDKLGGDFLVYDRSQQVNGKGDSYWLAKEGTDLSQMKKVKWVNGNWFQMNSDGTLYQEGEGSGKKLKQWVVEDGVGKFISISAG